MVILALGLGKTVVDGDHCWSYNPEKPMIPPPFGSPADMMKNTQNSFWCVNMGRTTDYNPLLETEYMLSCPLEDADYDNTLRLVASTYLPGSDRLVSGTGREGPRVVNFSPVLQDRILPMNDTIREVMKQHNLEESSLTPDTSILSETSLDSLGLAEVIVHLESKTQKDPFAEGFTNFRTIGELARLYEQ